MRDLSTFLSKGLTPILGASDIATQVTAMPGTEDAATGAEIPEIPIPPAMESNRPPTERERRVSTGNARSRSRKKCNHVQKHVPCIHGG